VVSRQWPGVGSRLLVAGGKDNLVAQGSAQPATNNPQRTTDPQSKSFALTPVRRYLINAMFDVIKSQLSAAGDKLSHLRRFL
jgi:hypothetical protein